MAAEHGMDRAKIEAGVRLMLEGMGEDPEREGLKDTPARVARAMEECCGGLGRDAKELFSVTFDAECHDVVIVRDIAFYSLCEHHLLPFFGVAHIAYIPATTVGSAASPSWLARWSSMRGARSCRSAFAPRWPTPSWKTLSLAAW